MPFPKVEQEELFLQAIEALDAGKTDTMIQLLDRAVPLDPTNPFAYVKRGQLFDLIGNNSRAVEDFSKALGLYEKAIDAANFLSLDNEAFETMNRIGDGFQKIRE